MRESVIIDEDGIEIKRTKKKVSNKVANKIQGVMPILCLVIFLALGFYKSMWHPGWVVFLAIPFTSIIIGIFKKTGKAFWTSFTIIVVTIVYVTLGFLIDFWHPGWLIFFLIPIVGIISE